MLPFAYQTELVFLNPHKPGGWEESREAEQGLQLEAGARFSFPCKDSMKWTFAMSITERWVTHRGSQHRGMQVERCHQRSRTNLKGTGETGSSQQEHVQAHTVAAKAKPTPKYPNSKPRDQ